MKKAMLFIIALLFSVGASAASLTLTAGTNPHVNSTIDSYQFNGSSGPIANASTSGPNFITWFNVTSDVDTVARVEWSFNPAENLDIAKLYFDSAITTEITRLTDGFTVIQTILLTAGERFWLNVRGEALGNLAYTMSVQAVPVPAALFLFAPALLGFLGLRRKSALAAAA